MKITFGDNLKNARKRLGKTQKKVAEEMGVHQITYNQWESEKRHPDVTMLKKLSSVLQVSVDDLLETEYASKAFSEMEIQIIRSYRAASNDTKIAVNNVLQVKFKPDTVDETEGEKKDTAFSAEAG